ncbi:MAG TPA: carbohydrate ABC transporter permease [Candidatus Latescibacteria bacterium]|nr:carbohydrate ABC transporter permease [Candidatus Handelsmanbacteria bacterium]HIL08770.1 carbohydrate ABC transporter permease [Candidatus Latescibacterota bacterium]
MNKGSKLALALMIFGAAVMVYPYAFMLGSSFKTRKEFAEDRQSLIPARFQPSELLASLRGEESARDWPGADWPLYQNYVDAIRYGSVDRYLANSFIYAVLITSAQLFFNVLAAYAFARMRFAGRDLLFTLLLTTMMVPPAVLLVPNFLVVRDLGLVDTLWGILLPSFAGAFGVFLLRQAFLNIPAELEQAARIDGCGSWGILCNVILPLSKPALITLGLFTFMGAWNMFEWPLVVLSNQDYYPLTVGLSFFRAETSSDWPRIFAASAMGAAPLIALFLVAQRYLVGGISLSGMKA